MSLSFTFDGNNTTSELTFNIGGEGEGGGGGGNGFDLGGGGGGGGGGGNSLDFFGGNENTSGLDFGKGGSSSIGNAESKKTLTIRPRSTGVLTNEDKKKNGVKEGYSVGTFGETSTNESIGLTFGTNGGQEGSLATATLDF